MDQFYQVMYGPTQDKLKYAGTASLGLSIIASFGRADLGGYIGLLAILTVITSSAYLLKLASLFFCGKSLVPFCEGNRCLHDHFWPGASDEMADLIDQWLQSTFSLYECCAETAEVHCTVSVVHISLESCMMPCSALSRGQANPCCFKWCFIQGVTASPNMQVKLTSFSSKFTQLQTSHQGHVRGVLAKCAAAVISSLKQQLQKKVILRPSHIAIELRAPSLSSSRSKAWHTLMHELLFTWSQCRLLQLSSDCSTAKSLPRQKKTQHTIPQSTNDATDDE